MLKPNPFDKSKITEACGLTNTGSICYMNSLIQSLATCTSVTQFFMSNEAIFRSANNRVAIAYIDLLYAMRAATDQHAGYNAVASRCINPSNVCSEIIAATLRENPSKNFGRGQEDAGEGLHLFLDAVGSPDLNSYFLYKYVTRIWCMVCAANISDARDDTGFVIEVPLAFSSLAMAPPPSVNPLNAFLYQSQSDMDGFVCNRCKHTKCCRTYQLARIPEIITVMFNKFAEKVTALYPALLTFPSTVNTAPLTYEVVATIEHAGGTSGGHYWANALRATVPSPQGGDITFMRLDDETVSQGSPAPTPLTYFVFYHCI